jgi:diadenosine tetraphosphate (Ap4A) HIT family hydrolase
MDIFTLWENETFTISTPKNPHIPYDEGLHVIVAPNRQDIAAAWNDPEMGGASFELAAKACKIMEDLGMAPWFNLQANGNWGLLPGAEPHFHIHIYGRNKTDSWGKPVTLPEAPGTYQNDPMPEADRNKIAEAFRNKLAN